MAVLHVSLFRIRRAMSFLFFHATMLAGHQLETLWQFRRLSNKFRYTRRAHYDTVAISLAICFPFGFRLQILFVFGPNKINLLLVRLGR